MSRSPNAGAPPWRTCVGCRARAPWTELVRLRLQGGEVAPAARGAPATGRGAWLHPARACLDRAVRSRAFPRAFRAPVALDAEAAEALWNRVAAARRL
jgi:hypothetical protein